MQVCTCVYAFGTPSAQKIRPHLKFAALPRCSLRTQPTRDPLRAGEQAY